VDIKSIKMEEADLNQAVGHAISQWSKLEFILANLFSEAIGLDLKLSVKLLSLSRNFDFLIRATDVAVKNKSGINIKEWDNLRKYIKDLSEKRNLLSHTSVIVQGSEDSTARRFIPKVGPKIKDMLLGEMESESLSKDDIINFTNSINDALERTKILLKSLRS